MEKNNFMEQALGDIAGLSIHWSSDCNMACKYCYIEKEKIPMATFNRKIREALGNKTFINNIKKVFSDTSRQQIIHLSLWGAEPTINAPYFKEFSAELLDYFPNVNEFMFSTNALLGADCLYNDFIVPLMTYAETHQRKMRMELQFSLDGPPEFNDDSRHAGASATTINAIHECLRRLPEHLEYFCLDMFTKATLDISYMRTMVERGLPSFQWYYKFFNDLQLSAQELIKGKNVILRLVTAPTLVDPGYYTKEDGVAFAEWLKLMRQVNLDDLSCYKDSRCPLFVQGLSTVGDMITTFDVIPQSFHKWSCSAGKNNLTIDYEGNLYSCNRLCKNSATGDIDNISAMKTNTNIKTPDKKWVRKTWGMQLFHYDLKARRYFADCVLIPMAMAGQINPEFANNVDMRNLLYALCCGIMCHVGIEEEYTKNPFIIPTSYARLFGNGAMEELMKYQAQRENRGEVAKWNIVM